MTAPGATCIEPAYQASCVERGAITASPTQLLQTQLAPAPILDKFPVVIGQALSGTYLSSAFRLCTSGFRTQFVDALTELLEHDPHARGVVRQRLLAVAGARVEVLPADVPKDDPDYEHAVELQNETRNDIARIPRFGQRMASLLWAIIYGVGALEKMYERTPRWQITELKFLHTRRLSYPDSQSWDLYVWDQGSGGALYGQTLPTGGLRIADYPHKFIVHTPQLGADYPTRDGEGRYIAFYLLLKRTIVRATAQDFERVIRPWVVGYFQREFNQTDRSFATKEDIAKLDEALRALGAGSLNGVTLPDSVRIELLRAVSNMNPQQFVEWIDAQVSKSLLGQTFTTETGRFGSRSTAEVGAKGTEKVTQYDARCFEDTLEEDVFASLVALNHPDTPRRLYPRAKVHVIEPPSAEKLMQLGKDATSIDMPVDIDWLAEECGIRVLAIDDSEGRRTRMLAPGKAAAPPDPLEAGADGAEGDATDDVADDTEEDPAQPAGLN